MKARAYSWGSSPHDFEGGRVAEVHFDDGRSAQVSCSDDGRVLIRLYPPNGTHEYGGPNMAALSMVVLLTDEAVIEDIHTQPATSRPPTSAPPSGRG